MKRERKIDLREADRIGTPAVRQGTTGTAYIDALRSLANGKKQPVSLRIFARWIDLRYGLERPVAIEESTIERFREELASGAFRSESRKKYRSLRRQAPSDIFHLHNAAVGKQAAVARRLIDSHRFRRLKVFAALTPPTRKALLWFHEQGVRTMKSGRKQLMTQSTRDGSLAAVLWLLRETKVFGLEHLTRQSLTALLSVPNPADREFRRVTRTLYSAQIVFKACVQAGLLTTNPLEDADSSIFAAYAERDFLPPAEVDRVRDLSTVDNRNPEQVRDRLVVLLLIDTAMRKSELAAIALAAVRRTDGGTYQIRLESDGQKMTGKPAAYIGVLYPETQALLERYLAEIRPHARGNRLIVDADGNDASPEAIYRAVVREGARMSLKCYHSGQRPGCHDLRRTFATVNSSPLGLRLTTAELAERMRTSFDIVHEHYVVRNVLRAALNEEEYRRRLSQDPLQQGANYIEGLARLGIEESMLEPIRQRIDAMTQPAAPAPQDDRPRVWIAEKEALHVLGDAWAAMPKTRTLRDYMRERGSTQRRDKGGNLYYDAIVIRDMVETYIPLTDVIALGGDRIGPAQEKFVALSIGRLALVRRVDVAALLKDRGNGRHGTLDRPANCKTYPAESAKHTPERGILVDDNAA